MNINAGGNDRKYLPYNPDATGAVDTDNLMPNQLLTADEKVNELNQIIEQ